MSVKVTLKLTTLRNTVEEKNSCAKELTEPDHLPLETCLQDWPLAGFRELEF